MIPFVARHKTVGSFRRVDIVRFLARRGESTVGEVAQYERFSDAAASYQLNKLQREGITFSRREGKNTYYWLTKNFLRSALFKQMIKTK